MQTKENAIYAEVACKLRKWGISPLPLGKYNPNLEDNKKCKAAITENWTEHCHTLMSEELVEENCIKYPEIILVLHLVSNRYLGIRLPRGM
jgi:hypothetical protein